MTSRAVCLSLLACALLGASSGKAFAGAWTLKRGTGLVIADVAAVKADERIDAGRRPGPAPDFSKIEGRVLLEYGLTDTVTLRARGAYEDWRQGGPDPSKWQGLSVGEAGARVRVLEKGRFVGAVEGSLRLVEPAGRDVAAEFEARALGGVGFEVQGRSAFVDAQLGYRFRPEAETDEALLDLTAGVRPFERTLLLVQSFSTVATSLSEDGMPAYDRHKIEASVVFDVTERWSLQVGAGRTVAGANTLDERSAFASLWLRF